MLGLNYETFCSWKKWSCFSPDVEGNHEKITKCSDAVLPITGDEAFFRCLAVAGLPLTKHEGPPEVCVLGSAGHQKCPLLLQWPTSVQGILFLCFVTSAI